MALVGIWQGPHRVMTSGAPHHRSSFPDLRVFPSPRNIRVFTYPDPGSCACPGTAESIGIYASLVPELKIGMLPLDTFFKWQHLPILRGNDKRVLPKLRGTSEIHDEYFRQARIAYPPDLSTYPEELQDVCTQLTPAQIEVLIYGEKALGS